MILAGAVVLGGVLIAAAYLLLRARSVPPSVARRRRVRAFYASQAGCAAAQEHELIRRLEQLPALATPTSASFEARQDLLAILADRRYQAALARWCEWRGLFLGNAGVEGIDQVEAILSQLAERLAVEDFDQQPRERLVELVRAHPYFNTFTRRSPPGVRRFFQLFNKGEHQQLLAEWPDVVAAWWEDEGGAEPRRSIPVAPELRAVVVSLSNRAPKAAA